MDKEAAEIPENPFGSLQTFSLYTSSSEKGKKQFFQKGSLSWMLEKSIIFLQKTSASFMYLCKAGSLIYFFRTHN